MEVITHPLSNSGREIPNQRTWQLLKQTTPNQSTGWIRGASITSHVGRRAGGKCEEHGCQKLEGGRKKEEEREVIMRSIYQQPEETVVRHHHQN
jgi:hypothetical protein